MLGYAGVCECVSVNVCVWGCVYVSVYGYMFVYVHVKNLEFTNLGRLAR